MAAAFFSRRARSAVESAGTGRRALRAARRAQVSAPLGSVASVEVPDSFEQSFVPHRRVISCDSDLLALDATLSSVSRVLPSSGSLGRARASVPCGARGVSACCSPGCGALVGGFGALCAGFVQRMHVAVWIIQEMITLITIRGNTGLKLVEERRRRTRVRSPEMGVPS